MIMLPMELDAAVIAELVFVFTTAATEDDAEVITPVSDEVAIATRESVFALTAVVTPDVSASVFALTRATTDEEAVATVAFVFALTAAVPAVIAFERVVVAFSISD